MVNRYFGNTGRVQRIPEQNTPPLEKPEPRDLPLMKNPPPRRPGGGLDRSIQRFLSRISPANMEQEDLILILILYLLYRESGDLEFLITLAAFLLL